VTSVPWRDDETQWFEVMGDEWLIQDRIEKLGWGDGLPVIAPTREKVEAALGNVDIDPDLFLGHMPVSNGRVTPAKVASNCVLAGCRPETFPIVLTAVYALLRTKFNLTAVQPTTHPVAPLVIVHGEIAKQAGMNCGTGAFGPGNQANATIGRAIRLCLMNIGGARPGGEDRATQGQPSKYSYAVAENSEECPWGGYLRANGEELAKDAVTVFAGENPHNVNDHVNHDAKGVLGTVASVMANPGSNPPYLMQGEIFLALGPEHAATIARSGFTYRDVQLWLFEHARIPLARLKAGNMWGGHAWPAWLAGEDDNDDNRLIPVLADPSDARIFVVGGPGKQSSVIPGFGMSRCVTLPIIRNESDLSRKDES
jgi:hypothetical protein